MMGSLMMIEIEMRRMKIGKEYDIWKGIGEVGELIVGILMIGEEEKLLRVERVEIIIEGIIGMKMY